MLVDAHVRDLFLTLDQLGHIQVLWTDQILDEVRGALINKLNLDEEKVQRLLGKIAGSFPAGKVHTPEQSTHSIQSPDPGDQHVLDAAARGEADTIVTYDRRGFPEDEALYALDLEVVDPDEALQHIAEQSGIEVIVAALVTISERLTNPPVSVDELLVRLASRVPTSAREVTKWLQPASTGEHADQAV